jgi:Ca-activated chloride channel family protein
VKRIQYTKFTGDDLGIEAEDLLRALADYFLQSGYHPWDYSMMEMNPHTMEALRKAIEEALLNGDLFDQSQLDEMRQRLEAMTGEQMQQLVDRLTQKLMDEGYLTTPEQAQGQAGQGSQPGEARFEIADKSVDFLGFKTLKDLLGSLGRASFGAHDTRDLATGVEASGGAKQYEFGDTLNLDISATLFSAMQREGVRLPIDLEYSDLHVHQAEYQSSCATVLMLDCSHSMILYGEDRFTPAKRVALALAHLIRTQYPGDTLRCVLFHDSAEELRLGELARVRSGTVLHQHPRRSDPGAAPARAGKEGHEADHHDHRRQALGPHAWKTAASTATPSASTPS